MILFSSLRYCKSSIFFRGKVAYVYSLLSFFVNVSVPLVYVFCKANAFNVGCVINTKLRIAYVLTHRTFTKVVNSIVSPVSVYMVNIVKYCVSVCVNPSKAMCPVKNVVNTDYDISRVFFDATSNFAIKKRSPANFVNPSKNASFRIVMKDGFKNFLSKHFDSFNRALRGFTATSKVLAFGCPLAVRFNFSTEVSP